MTSPLVPIDLHWHLHYSREDRRPFALDPDAMVERSRRVVVSGASVPTLDPVDTLLTLAFHAARSDGHRLVWLKDVERAVAVEEPDLDELGAAVPCSPLRTTGRDHLVPRTVAARCGDPRRDHPRVDTDLTAGSGPHRVGSSASRAAARARHCLAHVHTIREILDVGDAVRRPGTRCQSPAQVPPPTARERERQLGREGELSARSVDHDPEQLRCVRPQSADGAMDSQDQPTSYHDPKREPCASTRH